MRTGWQVRQNSQSGNARKGLTFRTLDAHGGGVVHRYSDGLEVYVPPKHSGLTVQHVQSMNDGGLGKPQHVNSGGLGPTPSAYIKVLDNMKKTSGAKYSKSSAASNPRRRA